MDKICCIFDFQGFVIGDKFLVREFGWANMDNDDRGIEKFSLRGYRQGISQRDQNTIRYNENKVHGLSFIPGNAEKVLDLDLLDAKIQEVYNKCKTGDRSFVVYKGETKKDVLANLKIPSKNLEKFGCPKFPELKKYHKGHTCRSHKNNLPCSLEVVNVYRSWLRENGKEIMFISDEESETDESE